MPTCEEFLERPRVTLARDTPGPLRWTPAEFTKGARHMMFTPAKDCILTAGFSRRLLTD
jgi:hypothetical protein